MKNVKNAGKGKTQDEFIITPSMKKLKQRWGIESNLQIFLILLVFALTGSSSVKLAKPVLDFFGFTRAIFPEDWHYGFLYWTIRILIIFPLYQVLLLAFGWIFGQFRFFWNFEKKMMESMGLGFLYKLFILLLTPSVPSFWLVL